MSGVKSAALLPKSRPGKRLSGLERKWSNDVRRYEWSSSRWVKAGSVVKEVLVTAGVSPKSESNESLVPWELSPPPKRRKSLSKSKDPLR